MMDIEASEAFEASGDIDNPNIDLKRKIYKTIQNRKKKLFRKVKLT